MNVRTWFRNQLVRSIGRFRRPLRPTDGPTYRILCYHQIRPRQKVAFQHQLDRLQKQYNVVDPDEFRNNEGHGEKLNLLLSFDDGFLNWESQVLPELRKRALKGIFFVCPDLVGLEQSEAAGYCRNHLDLEPALALTEGGLDELLADGHTLGNHLLQHADLRSETDEDRIESILDESQNLFEERFDRRPDWLAYPFGDYFSAPETLKKCVQHHFDRAVTLIPGANTPSTDELFLHRDAFSPDYSARLEAAWLAGGYDPLFRFTHLMKPLPA